MKLEQLGSKPSVGTYNIKTAHGDYNLSIEESRNVLVKTGTEDQIFVVKAMNVTVGKDAIFELPSDEALVNTLTTSKVVVIEKY